jgi:hypothetical protein
MTIFLSDILVSKIEYSCSPNSLISNETFPSSNDQAILEKTSKYWAHPLLQIL